MGLKVYFSFDYITDLERIKKIPPLPDIDCITAAGITDASLWQETKKKGDKAVHEMVEKALEGTSVTVIFIGSVTIERIYLDHEIDKSLERGNGLVGIKIDHLRDQFGEPDKKALVPPRIREEGYKVAKYVNSDKFVTRIEEAAQIARRKKGQS